MDENILVGKTLLVVDDEADLRDIVASELEFMGAKVFQAENITNAQKILKENSIDLIVSDIRMPGGTGVDLLDIVKAQNVDAPPVILITGFADITTEDAFDKGAEALINKPFKLDDLIRTVVRHTSPYESRFAEESTGQKSIEARVEQFGRGGASIEVDLLGKKFDIGEQVKFKFNYQDTILTGAGVCRWFKQSDQGSNKARLGIEFLNLDTNSTKFFFDQNRGKNKASYIPAYKS